jgi:hypothetical protein
MANIIIVGGKVDEQFHEEINKHAAGGYQPVLMSSVAKNNARTGESEIHVTVLMQKPLKPIPWQVKQCKCNGEPAPGGRKRRNLANLLEARFRVQKSCKRLRRHIVRLPVVLVQSIAKFLAQSHQHHLVMGGDYQAAKLLDLAR